MTGEGSLGAFDGQPELQQYRREEYRQYYKGVPVSSGYADFFVTPQGRRPVVPDGSEVVNVWAPRYEATVDAHTGELIRIG